MERKDEAEWRVLIARPPLARGERERERVCVCVCVCVMAPREPLERCCAMLNDTRLNADKGKQRGGKRDAKP